MIPNAWVQAYDSARSNISRKVRRLGRGSVSKQRNAVDKMTKSVQEQIPFACGGEGCFGCCRGQVCASDDEVKRIVPRLDNATRMRILSLKGRDISDDTWCPLLDPEDKTCTIYDERPLTCRAYHNVTETNVGCWPNSDEQVGHVAELMAVPSSMYLEAVRSGKRVGALVELLIESLEGR